MFRLWNLQPVDLNGLVLRILSNVLEYEHRRPTGVQDLPLVLGKVVANQIVIDVDLLLFFEIVQRGGMMLGGVGEPLVTEDVQDGVLVVPAGGTNDAAQPGERNISTGPSRFFEYVYQVISGAPRLSFFARHMFGLKRRDVYIIIYYTLIALRHGDGSSYTILHLRLCEPLITTPPHE